MKRAESDLESTKSKGSSPRPRSPRSRRVRTPTRQREQTAFSMSTRRSILEQRERPGRSFILASEPGSIPVKPLFLGFRTLLAAGDVTTDLASAALAAVVLGLSGLLLAGSKGHGSPRLNRSDAWRTPRPFHAAGGERANHNRFPDADARPVAPTDIGPSSRGASTPESVDAPADWLDSTPMGG